MTETDRLPPLDIVGRVEKNKISVGTGNSHLKKQIIIEQTLLIFLMNFLMPNQDLVEIFFSLGRLAGPPGVSLGYRNLCFDLEKIVYDNKLRCSE